MTSRTSTTSTTTSSIAPTDSLRRTSPLLDELDREWARLRRRPSTLRTIRSWSLDGPLHDIADDARDVDDIINATQPQGADARHASDVLRELIELSATHDLAGRIVLQRLLGGLISAARRWGAHSGGIEPTDVMIGAAWIAIRDFDTTRRHCHVAPAIIADALWIGFRRDSRRMAAREIPVPANKLASQAAPEAELDPIPALAGTLRAAARAGVASAELDVIRVLAAARTPSQAARNCQVAPRTIRNRRDAAGAAIRDALGREWADWRDPLVAAA